MPAQSPVQNEPLINDIFSVLLYSHPKMNANELVANMAVSNIGAEKVMCLDAVKPYDYIEIILDGEDILEVIEHAE